MEWSIVRFFWFITLALWTLLSPILVPVVQP